MSKTSGEAVCCARLDQTYLPIGPTVTWAVLDRHAGQIIHLHCKGACSVPSVFGGLQSVFSNKPNRGCYCGHPCTAHSINAVQLSNRQSSSLLIQAHLDWMRDATATSPRQDNMSVDGSGMVVVVKTSKPKVAVIPANP